MNPQRFSPVTEAESFVVKYKQQGALLDANLLLVYVVGVYGRNYLSRSPHTKQYTEDFPLIEKMVQYFSVIHTTPNILTEVSNLGRKLGYDFFDVLGRVIRVLDEHYWLSKDAAETSHFRSLGLTDSALFGLSTQHLIITADFALYQTLRSSKIDAINFNHLRPYAWRLAKL